MTQPLNLCRQMSKQFRDRIAVPSVNAALKAEAVNVLNLTGSAKKFIMPHGGILLDDPEFRAIDADAKLRLPFPVVALEFTGNPGSMHNGDDIVKTIVLAAEHEAVDGHPETIGVTGAYFSGSEFCWFPLPTQLVDVHSGHRYGKNQLGTRIFLRVLDKELFTVGDAEFYDALLRNGAFVLMGFLNALACSNVHVKNVPVTSLRKAMRPAIPFDEYHVLTVDVPGRQVAVAGGTHTGRHPREHLRRGHIRRYENGLKTWVNACVVAAGSEGKITKDYAMRKAA